MTSRHCALIPLACGLALATLLASPRVEADGPPVDAPGLLSSDYLHAPNGLYPIWEDNGLLLGHRHFVLSYRQAQFGILDAIQVGVKPSELIFRVPNVHAKVSLYRRRTLSLTAQVALFVVLPGASEAFVSSSYTSWLHNPNFTVFALPLSLSATWKVTKWLAAHNTLTVLNTMGDAPVQGGVTVGNYLSLEFLAFKYHGFFLHGGEVGFWDHNFGVFGASYRFHYRWFEARIGYVYRASVDGLQGQPLFDVGLLF
ncbi:MAG: hypothetical protein IT371_23305 [Deltaproteobacteria bacterium]|nr:hypothetical protein [Deltaproteobacteria bacterium]